MNTAVLKFCFFWGMVVCLAGCKDENKEYYENGKVKKECQDEKDKGSFCKSYYEDGKLMSLDEFSRDKKNKLTKTYFKNGQLKFEGKEVNGTLVYSKSYDAKGVLLNECHANKKYTFYEYYKNLKPYKISYISKIVKDTSTTYNEDSTIVFSLKDGRKFFKTMSFPDVKGIVVSVFSGTGGVMKPDTIRDEHAYDAAVKNLMKSDTVQVQYLPVNE